MNALDQNNSLFKKLAENPPSWWKVIVEDKDISVQVRKDNTIDVYFNCGAIITGLKYSKHGFSGKISSQYIPLGKEYYPYEFSPEKIEFATKMIRPISLNNFSNKSLKKVKSRINQYFPKSSEKGIQASFIKKDPYFIDMEFMGGDSRMDLIRLDFRLKKIVFVELKLVGNKEIYNNDIVKQLCKYHDYIVRNRGRLIKYYKKIFQIKKDIGILPSELKNENISGFGILDKPLLLFGDCHQSWIDGEFSRNLDNKIRNIAIGCYYFGSPHTCEILKKSKGNQRIFYSL